jgi:hypothetical protein
MLRPLPFRCPSSRSLSSAVPAGHAGGGLADHAFALGQRFGAAGFAEGLALLVVVARVVLGELGHGRGNAGFGVLAAAVQVVEAARHFTREFDVRRLVLAHRHVVGLVDQDVGGLQQRVAQEAVGGQVAVLELVDLVLVGRHALQPAQRRAHGQQREQFGVFGQAALDEDGALLGVQAGGDPVHDHVVDVALHHLALFVVRGQRMPVGDEEEALVFVLQPHPVLQGAVVVAEVHGAGGAHAGEDSRSHGGYRAGWQRRRLSRRLSPRPWPTLPPP